MIHCRMLLLLLIRQLYSKCSLLSNQYRRTSTIGWGVLVLANIYSIYSRVVAPKSITD